MTGEKQEMVMMLKRLLTQSAPIKGCAGYSEDSVLAIQLSQSTTFNNKTTMTVNLTNFHKKIQEKFPQTLILKKYISYLVHKTSTAVEQVPVSCVECY
jgi:hypothetical protein